MQTFNPLIMHENVAVTRLAAAIRPALYEGVFRRGSRGMDVGLAHGRIGGSNVHLWAFGALRCAGNGTLVSEFSAPATAQVCKASNWPIRPSRQRQPVLRT
jgi:hypothetical protein